MQVDPLEKLQKKLDKNFSFRKQELSILKTQIDASVGKTLNTFIRAGIMLIYAHWEGFIKESAKEFLNYLNNQSISQSNLKDNYHAVALKYKIIDCSQSKKSSKHFELLSEIKYNSLSTFSVDLNKTDSPIINIESNLKSSILDEILFILGIDKEPFELKYQLIDERLLKERNKIAHGVNVNFINQGEQDAKNNYKELYKSVLDLMDLFKEKILEIAEDKLYLKILS
ncbi:MAE_28990/MAE_18760 family HEPN-like nuclease [Bacillus cereus]